MAKDWKKELVKLLFSARSKKEVKELLNSLLTPSEYDELAKRWQIVKMLIGDTAQRKIKKELGVSIATVTRGSKELNYGNGVFQRFFKRLRS